MLRFLVVVVVLMADYKLATIPVVGVVTVDDVLPPGRTT
ncbi:MAG: hypothetical protein ACI9JD_000364 [Rhodococcus sp. (in: high G+C Gram-positive bacteria)]|jgi:hypothetical protein